MKQIKSKINWWTLLLEIPIIVFSILFALLLNNWKDDLKNEALEEKYLLALQKEFKINDRELRLDQKYRKEQLQVLKKLIYLAEKDSIKYQNPDSLNIWKNFVRPVRFYSPTQTVLNDLISSGNLNILDSKDLKYRIYDYMRFLNKAMVLEESERKLVEGFIDPYLVNSGGIKEFIPGVNASALGIKNIKRTSKLKEILQKEQLNDFIYLRWERLNETYDFEIPLAKRIKQILEGIEKRLKKISG